jgi:ribulose-bisphosphate carboxylase large chain
LSQTRTASRPVIRARYFIETAFLLAQAAATMAGEQSTGTFLRVPGETDALRERFAANVVSIEEGEHATAASLPGSGTPGNWDGIRRTGEVTLEWPLENIGPSLPNLLATVAGNLSELKAFSALRLLDLDLPVEFLTKYQGPQFGVAGTRSLSQVYDRPLIGTILKPSLGMDAATTAEQVRRLAEAGIDFIKDDELQADGAHCPFHDRVTAVMRVLKNFADRAGKRVMYAPNLTGEIDEMLTRHDHVLSEGGTCVMVSMNSIGLPAMRVLRAHAQLPIHGHRNGWGMLGRSPAIGMSFIAFSKIWRLAGIDHTHVNGLRNKFCESDASVVASARSCLTPMFAAPAPGCEVMPVFSSGQTAHQAPDTFKALGSTDLIYACGGGIMGHPSGPAAGVRSLQQAWEAAMSGTPLRDYALEHSELAQALETFGV